MNQKNEPEKILVVEDEKVNIDILAGILKPHYRCLTAKNGETAFRRLSNSPPPDLILLDILMPGMDGYEICRKLKSDDRTAEIPVLFISALRDISEKVRAFRSGGADFIAKPFQAEEVLARVRTHLEIKKIRDSLQTLAREKEDSNRMLKAILNSIPDVIVTVDENLRLVNSNRDPFDFCPHIKSKGESVVFTKRPDGELDVCPEALLQTIRTGRAIREFRTKCDCRSAGPRTVVLNTTPLWSPEKKHTGAVVSIRDISRMVELERKVRQRKGFRNIVGQNESMRRIFDLLEQISEIDVDVLITGESGTGKELVTDAIHHGGSRSAGPLVKVNCPALSESLLQSELFGHVCGAFTGASHDREGIFQTAAGGTVFLDEIGDMSPDIQAKLLRFVENREFQRLGDSAVHKADVRIVAATNRDLAKRIENGLFREDLYYRLKGILIHLPPLRDRTDDIPLLCDHFLALFSGTLERNFDGVDEEVMERFMTWPWPGNVRELRQVLKHACILCPGGLIRMLHMPEEFRKGSTGKDPAPKSVPACEPFVYSPKLDRKSIVAALDRNRWNKAAAAKDLGIGRNTLYRYIRRLGISK